MQVADLVEAMERDTRTVQEIIDNNNWPPNPVIVKALIQTTMGSSAPLYNGGILRATVRYFDACERRPGLPPDVAALVDELSADKACIQLVNTNHSETRSLIVQAGAFGEHSFTDVSFDQTAYSYDGNNPGQRTRAEKTTSCASTTVNGKHFTVELPPDDLRTARMRPQPLLQRSQLRLPLARGQSADRVESSEPYQFVVTAL